jgi:beta-lactam-binding protein with PASTA domain
MLGESVRRRQPKGRRGSAEPRPPRAGRGWQRWRPLLIALPVAILVPFLVGYLIAVFVLFPPPEVSAAGVPVPDLVGRSVEEAQRDLVAVGLGPVSTSDLPHPSAPPGRIIAQTPLPGQQLRPGAGVTVAVSTGRPAAVVPDVIGFSAERAESLLRRTGFSVSVVTQESPAPAGRVIRTEPDPAQQLTLPAAVTLVVSAGPPAAVEPDTIFGDAPLRDPPESGG